ncbi:serine hydrolase domain-containing protein [Rhabdothermincola salaria]|uniref:serine hydrolase domain-containing protein n=1 Tax=Rhabdothermincola salaria TaxID=2903142 RepID=UPI001E3D7AB8|nr:serine hydrolase domain-containing protein [Rhabdothermincola salaria]MCD9625650.1 beta-lactamase family protein [Rhabdothermincola salaria]
MGRTTWSLAAGLLLTACAGGAESSDPEQTSRSKAPSRTAEVFADLDAGSPGCSVAVRHPEGTFDLHVGAADVQEGVLIDRDTLFDVGSVSKQFTAGAIALLVVDGDLALDDDITELLPDLGRFDDTITVGDLLHHTSGLPDYISLLDAELDEPTTMADAVEVVVSDDGAPTAAPGERFEYSNTNYVLLALIVEAVTGRPFPDVVDTEILGQLGMSSSVVRDDQGVLLADQAPGYAFADDAETTDDDGDGWVAIGSAWRQTGDGALHSTALELLRWAELFLLDPIAEEGLGSPAWLDVMLSPGPLADEDGTRYGGGLELTDGDRGPVISHGGSWIGYSSAITMEPASGVAVAVTCNVDSDDAESRAAEVLDLWAAS